MYIMSAIQDSETSFAKKLRYHNISDVSYQGVW